MPGGNALALYMAVLPHTAPKIRRNSRFYCLGTAAHHTTDSRHREEVVPLSPGKRGRCIFIEAENDRPYMIVLHISRSKEEGGLSSSTAIEHGIGRRSVVLYVVFGYPRVTHEVKHETVGAEWKHSPETFE